MIGPVSLFGVVDICYYVIDICFLNSIYSEKFCRKQGYIREIQHRMAKLTKIYIKNANFQKFRYI